MMSNKELQELDVVIQALEANLQVFKTIQNELNDKQRKEVLYPMMVELRNLCDVCIPAFKPTDSLS